MALTEANKRKIEEEEEYRAKLRNKKLSSEKKKTHPITGCLLILLIIFFGIPLGIGLLISIFSNPTSSNTSESMTQVEKKTEVNVSVNFTGTQFVITNLDSYDCIGSWMNVNNKYWLYGYTLKMGQTYAVGAAEFAESNNTRFNPFAIKPTSFSIFCRGDNELSQTSWTGQF